MAAGQATPSSRSAGRTRGPAGQRRSRNCWARPTPRKSLGVSESDVLATLADGSLKGKKIGTAWRITRAALDEFLKS